MRLVKNANHFTVCFDQSLNHIFNRKQLDTYTLYYVIASRVQRACIGSSYMGYGDAEIGLKKLKNTLHELD